MNNFQFNLQVKVPSNIAFLIVLVFGLIMAIVVLNVGNGIIDDISEGNVTVTSLDALE